MPKAEQISARSNLPRKPKTRYTLMRQWGMLKALPAWPAKITYAELAQRLAPDFVVDPNTIRRDLDELSSIFPIFIDSEERTHYCCWARGADPGIRAMSVSEALAFRMVEQYLGQLLPTTVLDTIQGPFNQARKTLDALLTSNPTAGWIDKVRAIPPAQPMVPPQVDEIIQETIGRALLKGSQIAARYRPFGQEEARNFTLHPLGMILRTPSLYLVAKAWNYRNPEDIRLYALHRFELVEVLDDPVVPPDNFDLDREIERGLADFGERTDPIEIELLVSKELAEILRETPLAVRGMPPRSNQTMMPETDGRVRVRAMVNDSWQLRWWLRAQGEAVELVSPVDLFD